jgi:mono/diheme cytochrome c family protein
VGALKPRFRAEHGVITHLFFASLATSISSINLDCLAMLKAITVSTRWALLIAIMGLLSACSDAESTVTDDSARWYTPEQLAQGQAVFSANCAACHGSNGEGVANWQTPDSNGLYPAPPINGTAHAWHHSLEVLLRTINLGGEQLGGSMPRFQDRLTESEQRSVIAAFQDHWPDAIYARWAKIKTQ